MQVSHDAVRHQFSTVVEGHVCVIDYRLVGGIMTITHTSVPQSIGGRGIAAELTRAALGHARAEGWKVIPACSYAIAFMKRYPEFDDLRAP
jgi:predicted GNAT family acetyltransferase